MNVNVNMNIESKGEQERELEVYGQSQLPYILSTAFVNLVSAMVHLFVKCTQ